MIFEITILLLAIVFIVVASVWLRWNAFFLLIGVSAVLGFLILKKPTDVVPLIGIGFGEILSRIALIVIFGALLGNLLQSCGAMDAIGKAIFNGPLGRYPSLAMGITGIVVGIPVFCDAGYVVLSHIPRKWQFESKQKVATTLMLAAGLYLAHTLIPPTPGPTAVVAAFGASALLGPIIFCGLGLSLIALLALWLIVKPRKAANKVDLDPQDLSLTKSLFPLILPLALIALGNLGIGLQGGSKTIVLVLAQPAIALALGCIAAIILYWSELSAKRSALISNTLEQAMPILLLTGAGGALGKVISQSTFVQEAAVNAISHSSGGVWLLCAAFGTAILFKTLQGSSTGAMVIAGALLAPLTSGAPGELLVAVVFAIGAGALAVSHTNDSFFWVIAKFESWSTDQALRRWSVSSIALSVSVFLSVLLFYVIWP